MTDPSVGPPLLLAFEGRRAPPDLLDAIRSGVTPGVTLYRALNLGAADEVVALTDSLVAAAREGGQAPPIIAVDQEGGQLEALGESTTALPGSMALAATGSEELARRAGTVIGREMSALGLTVDWAPVCDVNSDPRNPGVGTRSFGDDPALVARLVGAMVGGIRSAGVATTAKHFPGGGDTSVDPHHGLPQVLHEMERLRTVELTPFAAAVRAGVDAVMVSHVAFPGIDGDAALPRPAMLSQRLLRGVLRRELGFRGVTVSDALDMGAVGGESLGATTLAAVETGVDLLLAGPAQAARPADVLDIRAAFTAGSPDGRLDQRRADRLAEAAEHVAQLRRWLAEGTRFPLEVLRSSEHEAVAREVARRSVTVVRDRDGRLPLRLGADASILVLAPRPIDLTPADTSSFVRLELADAIRKRHTRTEDLVISIDPDRAEIAALVRRASAAGVVVLATLDATRHPGQAALVAALSTHTGLVVAALRTPYDLSCFPHVSTYLCTYSVQPVSTEALAGVLFGEFQATGRLPVHVAEADEADVSTR